MKAHRPPAACSWLILLTAFLVATQTATQATLDDNLVPLQLYWRHPDDNKTSSLPLSKSDQRTGYHAVRIEGYVLRKPGKGTRPLKQYYSAARGDYFLAASDQAIRDAKTTGYKLVGHEGYLFTEPQPGTLPLKLYWNPQRQDNFVAVSRQAEKDALSAGYTFVRIEGYVPAKGINY